METRERKITRLKEYKCFFCGKRIECGTLVGTGMLSVSVDRYVDAAGRYPATRPERVKRMHICEDCAKKVESYEHE